MPNQKLNIADGDVPICPPWWRHSLWSLHFPHGIIHPPGPGPINLPAEVNQILLALQTHTTSYLTLDQAAAKQMRKLAHEQLVAGVRALGEPH